MEEKFWILNWKYSELQASYDSYELYYFIIEINKYFNEQ